MNPVQDLIEDAHHVATHQDPSSLASVLQDVLGQKLVAYAVGDRHPKSIGRYARSTREPDTATLSRLIDLFTIVTILRNGMNDQAIKSWMIGTNPRLRGTAPISAVHDGNAYEVMGAAQAFITKR